MGHTGHSEATHSPDEMSQHVLRRTRPASLSIAVDWTIAMACRPRPLRTISRPLDSGAYRKARPGLRGAEAPMMPRSDFSGLLSSACALASAAAIGDRFIPPGGEATKQLWGVKTVSTVSTAAARIRLIPGGGLPLGLVSPQSM